MRRFYTLGVICWNGHWLVYCCLKSFLCLQVYLKNPKLITPAFPRVQRPVIWWPRSTFVLISVHTPPRGAICPLHRSAGSMAFPESTTVFLASWSSTCWATLLSGPSLPFPFSTGRPRELRGAPGHGTLGEVRRRQTRLESVRSTSAPPRPTQSGHLLGAKYRTAPPGLAELAFSKKVMTSVCREIVWRLISQSVREKMNKELLPVSSNT